jgi:bacterioferritin
MDDRQALIDMLNADLRDEHASVIRYLIHAYQAGEDTPLGSMLLSMAREEMWHMDWLADAIGEMGAEPDMNPGVYPHDPTSAASLLRSYIEWEAGLVKAYAEQAETVSDPEIKRILMQQSKESDVHRQRFVAALEKLGQEGEEPLVYEDTGAFSPNMLERLQDEMTDEYKLVLQHLRHAFVLEEEHPEMGELELVAMRHMKHLSHFAEELAESGHEPKFEAPDLDMSRDVEPALKSDLGLTEDARERFVKLSQEPELKKHAGLKIEVENMITQEEFLTATIEELQEESGAEETEAGSTAPGVPAEAEKERTRTSVLEKEPASPLGKLTVGSLIKNK